MKRVVIGMKDGKPFVLSCPTKIEVVFRVEKKKSLKKQIRTLIYKVNTLMKRG